MLTSFIVTMIAYAALNHTSQQQAASLVFVEFSAPIITDNALKQIKQDWRCIMIKHSYSTNLTDAMMQQIYLITANLAVPPRKIQDLSIGIQVNWDKGNASFMWRNDTDFVEKYVRATQEITYIGIDELNSNS